MRKIFATIPFCVCAPPEIENVVSVKGFVEDNANCAIGYVDI